MPRPSGGIGRREPCAKCGMPVFIAERLNVGKQLYHRTCFRCARCNSQLTLANYYETETENQFCCETCPDEEQPKQDELDNPNLSEKFVLSRSLSDEEKSAGLQKFDDQDDYSANFEIALENPEDQGLSKDFTLSGEQSVQFVQARNRFMTSQLLNSDDDSSEDETVPELPKSEPPSLPKTEPPSLPKTEPPDLGELEFSNDGENIELADKSKDLHESISSIVSSTQCESYDSGYPSNIQSLDAVVHSSSKVSDISDKNQPETANTQLDINEIVTKENKFPGDKREGTSLVKSRMLLFENKEAGDESNKRLVSTKSPEKKFIHKVPLEEEEQSSTGLQTKKSEVESDSDINSSLVDVNSKIEENYTEETCEESQENVSSKVCDDSVIIISSDSSKPNETSDLNSDSACESSFISSNYLPDKPLKEDEPIEISDSITNDTKSEDYPEDLNPFGDEEEEQKAQVHSKAQVSLNPFDEDDDEDGAEQEQCKPSPKPAVRKKIKVRPSDFPTNTPDHINEIYMKRISYNPFDADDANEEPRRPSKPRSYANTMKVIPAPRISLNPFWSDGEEPDDDNENKKHRPIPLPRNSRSSVGTPEPKPRKSGLSINSGLSSATFGSTTSLSSAHSSLGPTARKKKQAPKPPSMTEKQDSAQSSVASSPSPSVQHSPKLTPRVRKVKKAPLPPSTTSTPIKATLDLAPATSEMSPIAANEGESLNTLVKPSSSDAGEWEKEKIIKDELNRNRQSQSITSPMSSSDNSSSLPVPDKSTYGKWKRRKGPAPSRPIPQRRNIKPLPVEEIKRELEFIEIQQQGLEKQGVRLEQIIREKCEGPNTDLDSSLPIEVEDLILQLFELVNEKNELFRKQAELMYLRRQQRLEEEYADLEYQIRCLMVQPELNKTDSDKAREEELINRLVEVVERRNEIVECLEMDRVREAEEDDSINNQLNLYAMKREEDPSAKSVPEEVKPKKKNKKEKKFKFKHTKKVDVDKDTDDCDSSTSSKDKKKKKFNIF